MPWVVADIAASKKPRSFHTPWTPRLFLLLKRSWERICPPVVFETAPRPERKAPRCCTDSLPSIDADSAETLSSFSIDEIVADLFAVKQDHEIAVNRTEDSLVHI